MELTIGKQIKALRSEKGVTQEELANHLGISYQAVSKWENNVTSPDIQLLPELSVYFGVTIDQLFQLPNEAKLQRIANMIENERYILVEKFEATEKFLLELINEDNRNSTAYYLLTELYNHKVKRTMETATEYAKKALELKPNEKHYHTALIKATGGAFGDSYCNRHQELINYYKGFTAKHSELRIGYAFFIDQLMDDRRLSEAKEVLKKMEEFGPHVENIAFAGDIELALGNVDKALELWNKNVEEFKDNGIAYFIRAENLMKIERYEAAIKDYRKAIDIQGKPRYPEMTEAMAQAYELMGQYHKAIEAHEEKIQILKEDYGIVSGELVDESLREMERLRRK